jgi:hypothetical protein
VGKGEEALMKLVVERDVDEVASAGLSLGHVFSRTSLELELKTATPNVSRVSATSQSNAVNRTYAQIDPIHRNICHLRAESEPGNPIFESEIPLMSRIWRRR